MVWCEDRLICLIFRKKILFVSGHDLQERPYNYRGIFAFPEIDGVRLLTKSKYTILRNLPQYY